MTENPSPTTGRSRRPVAGWKLAIRVNIVWLLVFVSGVACVLAENPPAAGQVQVTSKPDDLEFELMNADTARSWSGLTPATVEGLPPGRYRAIFRKSGSVAQRYILVVGQGASQIEGDFTVQDEWQKARQEVDRQQPEIDKGASLLQKIEPALLRDLAAAINDEAIQGLLTKFGYAGMVDGASGATKEQSPALLKSKAYASYTILESAARKLPPVPFDLAYREWDADTAKRWAAEVDGLKKLKADREGLLAEAKDIADRLTPLVEDLLILAHTDPVAQALVVKYAIAQGAPPKGQ